MQKALKLYIYRKMATITSETFSEIKTFVFLDTETTGLPFFENNTTKITELCLTAVHANHLRLGVFPRVQNKLNFCFNPCKLIGVESEKVTGLSNNLLEESFKFSKETVISVNNFFNHNPQPICLVAHNGFRFDYPLLRREVDKTNLSLNEDILCVDTLISFRELLSESNDKIESIDRVDNIQKNVPLEFTPLYDQLLFSSESQQKNETTPIKQIIKREHDYPLPKKVKLTSARRMLNVGPSYKLVDIYSRLTKKEPVNSHQADGDVQMLIMCAAQLGDKFVDWSNQNAKKFCDIPAMIPGKRIGT